MPLPSASIHASILDVPFCDAFERLYFSLFEARAATLPPSVRALLEWADAHAAQQRPGGLSDMTLYFLLQVRSWPLMTTDDDH